MTTKRVLREAAWAPIAVLAINAVVVRTPYADELFSLLHFLGGAAAAFFFLQVLEIRADVLGKPRPLAAYVVSFAAACSVALFWEIGEFLWDRAFATELQHGLAETMVDLIFSVLGAAVSLPLVALFRKESSRARPR